MPSYMCFLEIAESKEGFRRSWHLDKCPNVGMKGMCFAVVLR